MTTTQVMLGASGAGYAVEYTDGRGEKKTYRFGRLTQEVMSAYSCWLIDRMRRRVLSVYSHDEAALKAALRRLEDDALSGAYEFFERAVQGTPARVPVKRDDGAVGTATRTVGGVLQTPGGQAQLAALLSGAGPEEMLALLAAKPAEVSAALSLVMKESVGGAEPVKDDWEPDSGNAQAPPPLPGAA